MGLQIEDGKGRGNVAEVNSENKLETAGVIEPLIHHINVHSEKVWSVPFENIANTGANDYIIYIKNTGTPDLHIADISLSVSAATQIEIHEVTGTAGGGQADITPVSHTVGSSQTPSADLQSDPDITGLSAVGTLGFIQCPVAATTYSLTPPSMYILRKGQAIAILVETTTITVTGVVTIMEVILS